MIFNTIDYSTHMFIDKKLENLMRSFVILLSAVFMNYHLSAMHQLDKCEPRKEDRDQTLTTISLTQNLIEQQITDSDAFFFNQLQQVGLITNSFKGCPDAYTVFIKDLSKIKTTHEFCCTDVKLINTEDQAKEWALTHPNAFEYSNQKNAPQFVELYTRLINAMIQQPDDNQFIQYCLGFWQKKAVTTGSIYINQSAKVPYARISDIGTDPKYRKKGIATHAILTLCQYAKQQGVPYVFLLCEDETTEKLYQKCGFKIIKN